MVVHSVRMRGLNYVKRPLARSRRKLPLCQRWAYRPSEFRTIPLPSEKKDVGRYPMFCIPMECVGGLVRESTLEIQTSSGTWRTVVVRNLVSESSTEVGEC